MRNTTLDNKTPNNWAQPALIKLIFGLFLLVPSLTTNAIVMRHDIDPNEYLLDTLDYQSVIVINGCTATLIAPRWLLTAAHCTYPNLHYGIAKDGTIGLLDETLVVKSVHNHPDFTLGNTPKHDIALVELSEPSFSLLPTPIYEENDELGSIMKLTGFGLIGNAVQGLYENCFPCALRGADNEVEEANEYHLRFRFDPPTAGNSLALEGVGAGGDSGGPAFIETEAGRFVAGVSSFGSWEYNAFDNYVRVSKELSWIYEVMGIDYIGNYSGPLYSEQRHEQKNDTDAGSFKMMALIALLLLRLFRKEVRT